jgi:hypothetical protein
MGAKLGQRTWVWGRGVGLAAAGFAVLAAGGCATSHYANEPEARAGMAERGSTWARVELDDETIRRPSSVPAGRTTFEVVNVGARDHTIRISGRGLNAQLPESLKPGQVVNLTVDLEPGTYIVMDPLNYEHGWWWDRQLTASRRELEGR